MNNFIKRFSVLIVVAMLTVSIVVFAACDGIEIRHTYSDEWISDAVGHWHPSICHEGFRTAKIPHELVDEVCTVCGWNSAPVIPDDPVVNNPNDDPDDDTPSNSDKEKIKIYFISPVIYNGIGMNYTDGVDNPFEYNQTLEVWAAHKAIDLLAPEGTKVVAMFEGTVIEVGTTTNEGNYVIIDHGDNVIATYASLQNILVQKGQKLSQGEWIGETSASAASEFMDGAHLHLAIQVNNVAVDPTPYIKGEVYREIEV